MRAIHYVQVIVYYPTPEDFFPSLFPKKPISPGKRPHNILLVASYFAPTRLVNTRHAVADTKESPGGWSYAEVGGTFVERLQYSPQHPDCIFFLNARPLFPKPHKYCGVAPQGPLLTNGYASTSGFIGNDRKFTQQPTPKYQKHIRGSFLGNG
jgi:hypothetical protein